MNREPVVDADGHIVETDSEIFEYLQPPYKGEEMLFAYPFFPTLDGWHRSAKRVTDRSGIRIEKPTGQNWLDYLNHANIAATVLFPTAGLAFGLANAVTCIGRDDIFFSASDYPHENKEEYPEKLETFFARPDLSDVAKRNVLWDAPIRMYNLDEAELRASVQSSAAAR